MSDTLTFELENSIKYINDGAPQESGFIEFRSPTVKELKKAQPLKQMLARAMMDAQEKAANLNLTAEMIQEIRENKKEAVEEEEEVNSFSASEVSSTINFSRSVDSADFIDIGLKLLTSGVGKVGGETKFTAHMSEGLEIEEAEKMVCAYVGFFMAKSLLN
jgi:predicted PP-loop superfamily ATPase